MNEIYSVCIPVKNEEKGIATAINSCQEQKGISLEEILVSANGTTDNTINIVRKLSEEDERIRLIEMDKKGKPIAWNKLVNEAKSKYLFFIDGDVYIPPDSFQILAEQFYDNSDLIIAGGRITKISEKKVVLPAKQNSIFGGFYLFDLKKLLKRMISRGYSKMPYDIVHDDKFLTFLLDHNEGKVVEEAKVYIRTYNSFSDHFKLGIRYQIGDKQLREISNGRTFNISVKIPNSNYNLIELWKKLSFYDKIALSSEYILMRSLDKTGRFIGSIIYPFIKNNLEGFWITSKSSKRPIDPSKI